MKYLVIIILLVLVGCKQGKEGIVKQGTNNPNFELTLLFEKDSCKVYRFVDDGRYIYWSDCRGNIQSNYSVSCGKNCTKTIHIQQETVK